MHAPDLKARYRKIIFFFGRVVLEFILWEIVAVRLGLGAITRRTRSKRFKKNAVQFRALAIKMGGLMIKVGQFLSARLDVLPAEITDELSGLQDEVPAEKFEFIRQLAEKDLGRPLAEVFEWVEETPLAAASLGQVHRARLFARDAEPLGFSEVVVKVQRPFIDEIVDTDLSALRRVGGWLQKYKPVSDRANVPELVEEFASTTLMEIDYLAEGKNAETFSLNFQDHPEVHVPRVVWSVTTRKVLTLENVMAIKLSDYDGITAAGIDRREVAKTLLDTYLKQIFDDGFFHADPHPGNLFVTPVDGKDSQGRQNWRLTFIDFGMVGHMPDNLRQGVRDAVIAVGTRDASRLVHAYQDMGVLLPSADVHLIEIASAQVFERYWGKSMKELREVDHSEIARFGMQFRELLFSMPFQIPENLLMFGRTVAILSGMCTGLDPEFNLFESIAPYATKLITEEGGSSWDTWLNEGLDILKLVIGLPGRIDRVSALMERGDFSVQTPLLERQVMHLEGAMQRVTGGLVFTALFIGGAILYGSDPMLGKIILAGSIIPLGWMIFFARGHHPWH